MQTGDIIFVEGSKWNPISWMIKLVSGGKYSHVAICIDNDLLLEAEYTIKCHVINVHKTKYLKRNHDIIHIDLTKEQIDELDTAILQFLGKKYDIGLIIKMFLKYVLHIPIHNKNDDDYVCSELVAELLLYLGAIDNQNAVNMSPVELHEYLANL